MSNCNCQNKREYNKCNCHDFRGIADDKKRECDELEKCEKKHKCEKEHKYEKKHKYEDKYHCGCGNKY